MTNLSTRARVFLPAMLFFAFGMALVPLAGVQNDEALFAAPYYQQNARDFCLTVFHKRIVLMVMSYIGTLKTALYAPILAIFGVNVWSIRLPMVFAGSLTIFFFYYLVQRSAGSRAAVLAAFLLAADPSFLLTNTFDWGPVALEHLFLVTGCLLVLRSVQDTHRVKSLMRDLALGFFFFGVALWNKAIFGWALTGLAFATGLIFWPEVKRAFTFRRAAIAGTAFLLGALPVLVYNLGHPFDTLRQNAHREAPALLLPKLRMLGATLDGSGLFGFIPNEDWADDPKTPSSPLGRTSVFFHSHLGEHRETWTGWAFLLALALIPLWWRSRAARFALVFMLVDWLMMASTRGAGAAVHHTILLWPMPQLFIGATFAAARRPLAAIAGVFLVTMNLLTVNDYIYKLERNGAAGNFTDALFPLSNALDDSRRPIYVIDWGMLNTLSLFHQGRLDLRAGDFPFFNDRPGDFEKRIIAVMFSDPSTIFIAHVRSREVSTGVREQFDRTAAKAGKREELIQSIADSNGRPVFEIFRLVPAAS